MNLEKKLQIGIKKTHPSFLKLFKIKQKNTPSKNNSTKTTPSKQIEKIEPTKDNETKIEEKIHNSMDKIKEENKSNKIEEENNIKEPELKKTPKEIFFQEYGFTTIIETIIASKKPMVGHFPILDLLFIYDSFIAELPNNYVDFVKEINNFFPCVLDTKLIAKSFENEIFLRSSLEELYYDVFEQEKVLKPFHNVALDSSLLYLIVFYYFL